MPKLITQNQRKVKPEDNDLLYNVITLIDNFKKSYPDKDKVDKKKNTPEFKKAVKDLQTANARLQSFRKKLIPAKQTTDSNTIKYHNIAESYDNWVNHFTPEQNTNTSTVRVLNGGYIPVHPGDTAVVDKEKLYAHFKKQEDTNQGFEWEKFVLIPTANNTGLKFGKSEQILERALKLFHKKIEFVKVPEDYTGLAPLLREMYILTNEYQERIKSDKNKLLTTKSLIKNISIHLEAVDIISEHEYTDEPIPLEILELFNNQFKHSGSDTKFKAKDKIYTLGINYNENSVELAQQQDDADLAYLRNGVVQSYKQKIEKGKIDWILGKKIPTLEHLENSYKPNGSLDNSTVKVMKKLTEKLYPKKKAAAFDYLSAYKSAEPEMRNAIDVMTALDKKKETENKNKPFEKSYQIRKSYVRKSFIRIVGMHLNNISPKKIVVEKLAYDGADSDINETSLYKKFLATLQDKRVKHLKEGADNIVTALKAEDCVNPYAKIINLKNIPDTSEVDKVVLEAQDVLKTTQSELKVQSKLFEDFTKINKSSVSKIYNNLADLAGRMKDSLLNLKYALFKFSNSLLNTVKKAAGMNIVLAKRKTEKYIAKIMKKRKALNKVIELFDKKNISDNELIRVANYGLGKLPDLVNSLKKKWIWMREMSQAIYETLGAWADIASSVFVVIKPFVFVGKKVAELVGSITKIIPKIKGFFKWIMGTKGQNRKKAADTIMYVMEPPVYHRSANSGVKNDDAAWYKTRRGAASELAFSLLNADKRLLSAKDREKNRKKREMGMKTKKANLLPFGKFISNEKDLSKLVEFLKKGHEEIEKGNKRKVVKFLHEQILKQYNKALQQSFAATAKEPLPVTVKSLVTEQFGNITDGVKSKFEEFIESTASDVKENISEAKSKVTSTIGTSVSNVQSTVLQLNMQGFSEETLLKHYRAILAMS